jgi:hypothetical protein
MEQLRDLLRQQHRDLADLASEFQRKDITPARIIRLMKLVQRNVEISERIVSILERTQGVAPDLSPRSEKETRRPPSST